MKKGDTWRRTATTPNPQAGAKQTTEITYSFQGTEMEGGKLVDKIDMVMKTSIEPSGPGTAQIEITDQESDGEVYFDHDCGHVLRTRAKTKMVMTVTVMGTKIDQSATSEVKMRLVSGEDGERASESEK